MSASALPVGFFLTSFESGGTERQMLELIGRLDRSRFEPHIACFHRRGVWLPRAETAAHSLTEFPVSGFARPATARALTRFIEWCRTRKLALLHTCDFYANVFGLIGGALARVPVRIANRRELNPDKTGRQIALQRVAYSLAHRVVANSAAGADTLMSERVPHDAIRVIPNGIDVGAYPPAPRHARRVITTVAKLRREKAHEVLVEAAALVLPRFPDLRFQLVGDGPREAALRALVAERGVAHAFAFLGHRDDVPSVLAGSDMFVLSSRSEAFPNGVLEAMAAGLPVIATKVGGLRELIDHGRTGLLVPPDDPRRLADALLMLIDDPNLASGLARCARRHVEERYSLAHMVARFELLYLTELAARGVAVAAGSRLAAHGSEARAPMGA
jgi:glycosyltransferase involved in cell wall biosynthesis